MRMKREGGEIPPHNGQCCNLDINWIRRCSHPQQSSGDHRPDEKSLSRRRDGKASRSRVSQKTCQSWRMGTPQPHLGQNYLVPERKLDNFFEFKPPARRGLRPGGEGEDFNHTNTLKYFED